MLTTLGRPLKAALVVAALFAASAGVAHAGGPITLPNGTVNTPYNVDLTQVIFDTWSESRPDLTTWNFTGALPPGETLSLSNSGPQSTILSGIPTAAGDYSFTFDQFISGGGHEFIGFNEHVDAASPVPEPSTWAMLILGVFGVSFAVRRSSAVRRQAAA